MKSTSSRKTKSRATWIGAAVATGLIVIALLVMAAGMGGDTVAQEPVFTVEEAPLTISVTSSGSIRNSDAIVLRNEVQGAPTILYIVEEGSFVKKGDLVVELDSSKLEDQKVDQEIRVRNAEASHINAKEQLKITEKKGESDIKNAEVNLELAILELEKYLGEGSLEKLGLPPLDGEKRMTPAQIAEILAQVNFAEIDLSTIGTNGDAKQGEYSQQLKSAENKITLAEEELKRAKTKVEGSRLLEEKNYISKTELEADELDYKRKQLNLEVAQSELELLAKYTRRKRVAELLSDVDKKAFALTQTQHQAASNLRDAEAQLDAKLLQYKREDEKYKKLIDQINKCKLYAPQDGMIVYGEKRGRWDEPLKQGMQVFERQELVRIPRPGGMIAEIKVSESMIEKVREGLPVILTFDALNDKQYQGTVKRVSIVPDAGDRWLNPDAKTYNVEVAIEDLGENQLKPGMSCTAEVIVRHYENTLFVPVQSVLRIDGKPTVQIMGPDGKPQPRVVVTALDNNRMVAIVSGLEEGDRVLLSPALQPAEKSQTAPLPENLMETANAVSNQPKPSMAQSQSNIQETRSQRPGDDMSQQQREGMERFLAMIPEAHREKVANMSQEERMQWLRSEEGQAVVAKMREQFEGSGGGQREGSQPRDGNRDGTSGGGS